jgi:hypothetical protein
MLMLRPPDRDGRWVADVDEVALVDEPLGQYPVVAGGDMDFVAAAADAAEHGACGEKGALGDVDGADGAAGRGDHDPPVEGGAEVSHGRPR